MIPAKLLQLATAWSLAFLLSAVLVAAGAHWPEPPPLRPALVWALVLLPPGLIGLWLASRWGRVNGSAGEEGESTGGIREQG